MFKIKYFIVFFPLISIAMEMDRPTKKSEGETESLIHPERVDASRRTNEELWQTIKKRVQLMRELKSKFKKPEQVQQTTTRLIPQSIAHLKVLFGEKKTEDQLLEQAIDTFKPRLARLDNNVLLRQLNQIIDNEKKYINFDVFYHGQKPSLAIISDVMEGLYNWLNLENVDEQTRFLRLFFSEDEKFKNVDEFLNIEPYKSYLSLPSFDHRPDVIKYLLPVNLALFGNAKEEGENTWLYYTHAMSLNPPIIKEDLKVFFKSFDFDPKFVDQILEINTAYLGKLKWKPIRGEFPGTLLQIFIAHKKEEKGTGENKPNIVDEISYLSGRSGYPFKFLELNSKELEDYPSNNHQYLDYYSENPHIPIIDVSDPNWKSDAIKTMEEFKKKVFDIKRNRVLVSKYQIFISQILQKFLFMFSIVRKLVCF